MIQNRTYPRMEKKLIYIKIFFLASQAAWGAYSPVPKIRVRIAKEQKSVLITGQNLLRRNLVDTGGGSKLFPGHKSIKYNCQRLGYHYKEKRKPVLLASLAGSNSLLTLQTNTYKGELLIMTSPMQDSCDVVLETDLELYISQLLTKEMNKEWPIEVLKAQAIAARTYAYHKMESKQVNRKMGYEVHYDLENSEKHQVTGDYLDRNEKTDRAAKATKGYILLTKKGNLTPIFFHAKCGGRTFLPNTIWTNRVEGYQSVPCPYCDLRGTPPWKALISTKKLNSFLNWASKKNHVKGVVENSKDQLPYIAPDRVANRKLRIYRDGQPYLVAKSLFRKYFGRFKISSNNFMIKKLNETQYTVAGKGLGHGVGMCQIGALDLARKGWGFKRILTHYFPGHKLRKVY